MNAKELNIKALIEKVQSLPKEYWIKRFKKIVDLREDKLADTEAELIYLFATVREEVLTQIELFLAKYDRDTSRNILTRTELTQTKNYLNLVKKDMELEGLEFDKGIEREIKSINSRTTKLQALEVKVKSKLSYLYSVVGNRLEYLFGEVTSDFYYMTMYEIIRAVGYDSDKVDDLELLTLSDILAQSYRATGESFDDVIWRLGSTFNFETHTLIGRDLFNVPDDNAIERLQKLFKSQYNALERNLETDMTYFSTLGQQESFITMEVVECIFTAIIDERTSDFCLEADGNVIPVDEIEPWVNAPPLHYFCRSSLTPVVKAVNWLTGDVYEVDDTFEGWYEKHFNK